MARGLATPGAAGARPRLPPNLHLLHAGRGQPGPRQVHQVRAAGLHRPPGRPAQPHGWPPACTRLGL